ncbi:MAG TPA: hypothetical protein VMH84_00345 [Xanthobacteraceae bacterium]|nr:hypothetical protein [Xanthobacteraceae bacterium]
MKVEFDYFSEMANSFEWPLEGIRFVRDGGDGNAVAFDMWEGHFYPIMNALFDLCFKQKAIPYLPLLKEWNECTGYEETDSGPVRELADTIDALRKIDSADISEYRSAPGEIAQILKSLISFLQSAMSLGQAVTITKDF